MVGTTTLWIDQLKARYVQRNEIILDYSHDCLISPPHMHSPAIVDEILTVMPCKHRAENLKNHNMLIYI